MDHLEIPVIREYILDDVIIPDAAEIVVFPSETGGKLKDPSIFLIVYTPAPVAFTGMARSHVRALQLS